MKMRKEELEEKIAMKIINKDTADVEVLNLQIKELTEEQDELQ